MRVWIDTTTGTWSDPADLVEVEVDDLERLDELSDARRVALASCGVPVLQMAHNATWSV